MLIVRFPTGVAVQYNAASYLLRGSDCWTLWTAHPDKGGTWIASVQLSAGAVIEAQGACRIDNDADGHTRERALQLVLQDLPWYARSFPSLVRQLKRALRAFDSTRGEWRPR